MSACHMPYDLWPNIWMNSLNKKMSMCWHARHSNVHLVTIEFPVSLKRCKLYCVVIFQLKNASLYKKRDLPSLVNIRQAVSEKMEMWKINRWTVVCMCVHFGYYNYFLLFVVIVCSLGQVFVLGLSRILITVLTFILFTSLQK